MDPRIRIIGCGPGSLDWLPPRARAEIESADIIAGAPHLLAWFPQKTAIAYDRSLADFLQQLRSTPEDSIVAVLVSGDPGCFSLSRAVIREFGHAACRIIPGISSVQLAFAAIGERWEDARLFSLHGRSEEDIPEDLVDCPRLALFLDARPETARVIEALAETSRNTYSWWLCEDLSWPSERIERIDPRTIRQRTLASRSIVIRILSEEDHS